VVLPKQLQIIQRDQWERVQKQLDRNRAISPRNTKHPYLLRGLILCGGCGSVYAGTPCHRRFYYRCITRCKKRPTITENIIDQTVWTAIREVVLNPDLILAQVKNLNEGNRKRVSSARNESSELDRLIEGLEKEESRILEAYRVEILSPAQLAQEMQKLTVRRTALQTQKAELSQQVRSPESARRSVMEYCKAAARQMDSFNFEERQRFLRLLIRAIVFNGDRVTIRGVIPVSEDEGRKSTEDFPKLEHSVLGSPAGNIATTASYLHGHNVSLPEVNFVLERAIFKPRIPQPRATTGQFCRAA